MLVISRKVSESIIIGDDVEVVVTEIGAERVKIGIKAPKGVPILRRELLETRDLNREASAASGKDAVDRLKRLQRHYGLDCRIDDTLNDALVAACLLPDSGARNIDSLLNEQLLPVLSQHLLARRAAQLRTHGVSLGYSEDEGISLHFSDVQDTAQAVALEV